MRGYFPFTDFDFYAYVVSGLILLVSLDYACPATDLMLHRNWSIVEGAVAIAAGYFTGLVAAMIATTLLEHSLFNRLVVPPSALMLGRAIPTRRDRFLARFAGTHYLTALPTPIADRANDNARAALQITGKASRESIFQYGFAVGRCSEDTCRRMDRDRREYEFGRNMTVVSLLSMIALLAKAAIEGNEVALAWSIGALLLAGVMFTRYIRYYASFHSQVIRAAAFAKL